MASRSSVVTADVVRKVAELARLRLPESELDQWTEQLSRILTYIDQLEELPAEGSGAAQTEPATLLRADEPRPGGGEQALASNAPRRLHGYGVVPRVVGSTK